MNEFEQNQHDAELPGPPRFLYAQEHWQARRPDDELLANIWYRGKTVRIELTCAALEQSQIVLPDAHGRELIITIPLNDLQIIEHKPSALLFGLVVGIVCTVIAFSIAIAS